MTPLVSVIIPAYNDPLRLEWCLAGLVAQDNQNFETIVVNDGGDASIESVVLARKNALRLQLLALDPPAEDFRAGAARNYGVRHSCGDLLLFVDQDMVLPPWGVTVHLQNFVKHGQDAAGCGRRISLSEDRVVPFVPPFNWSALRDPLPDWDGNEDVDEYFRATFLSCHLSVPAQLFCSVGGFDEEFVGYGSEDLDLLVRLARLHTTCINLRLFNAAVHLDHPSRHTADDNLAQLRDKAIESVVRNGGPLIRECEH